MGIPPEFVEMLTPMITMALQQQVGLTTADLDTESFAKKCEATAHFMHASGDNFVVPENTEKVHNAWAGATKTLKKFDGDHNTPRPEAEINAALDFLKANLN